MRDMEERRRGLKNDVSKGGHQNGLAGGRKVTKPDEGPSSKE